jgi:hypothetical protein
MNNNRREWLGDPNLEEALASLRVDANERLELPSAVRNRVRSRLEASIGPLALGESARQALDQPRQLNDSFQLLDSAPQGGAPQGGASLGSSPSLGGSPSLGPASLNGAAVGTSWFASAGKALLLSALLAGGIALVATVADKHAPVDSTAATKPTQRSGAEEGRERPLEVQPFADADAVSAALGPSLGQTTGQTMGQTTGQVGLPLAAPPRPAPSPLDVRNLLRTSPHAVTHSPAKPETSGDLNYELKLLRLARAALPDRPGFARELLRSYDKRFPDGILRKEYELLLQRAGLEEGPDVPRPLSRTNSATK